MSRNVLLVGVIGAAGILMAADPAPAAAKKKPAAKPDPAPVAVERVLRSEVAGKVDRRMQLAETLKQQPDSPSARWQAGFVKDGDSWRSFDEPQRDTASASVLDEYRRRRDEAPQSFPGQLDLANWCRKHGLKAQERAHLIVALPLTSAEEQPPLLERLGYTQIGTQWVSDEQRRDWQNAIRRTEASLKKWSAKLERIAERLAGSKAQRSAALAELRGIDDASAIPAIELVLAGRDEETARAAVETLAKIDGPEASLALAKQAVFSPWPAVRKGGTAALKNRLFEDFVPALIGLLAKPTTGSFRLFHDPLQGRLLGTYVVAVETENVFQVATLQLMQQVVEVRVTMRPAAGGFLPAGGDYVRVADAEARIRADIDAQRTLGDRLHPREPELEAIRDRIRELNGRVISVLADISGLEPTPDPRGWWQWWYDFTDAPPSGTKPAVVVVDEFEGGATPFFTFRASHSCFAAGTPVWTETGPVPIETIKVGDRVLAQDIPSGELGYKPVLVTTVNPPKDLLILRFGDESIVCTKGHRFWISGSGWTKARDIAPQTLLHTVTGNTPVWSVKPAPAEKTYNLVVDGFHTYFVGKSAILCQDLRSSNGRNCLVPGLHCSNAVAQAAK
ncbi:MAG: polymorphic toxin-type HINT domain-containing protein [Deltaproteobacteria bacterium]